MKLHHFLSRSTSLIRSRLQTRGQWRLPTRWRNKVLVEMPTPYLAIEFTLTTLITSLLLPKLVWATDEFSQHASAWPWASIVFMFLFLGALWLICIAAMVVSLSHGRALGDKLFSTPKPAKPSSAVTRLKERQCALRRARSQTKMRV